MRGMAGEEEGVAGWKALPGRMGEYLRNLFDLQFKQLLTPRMLPTLFLLAIVASAIWVAAYVAEGFSTSRYQGLLRLLLLGPAAFLTLVTLARIALELCLAIFRLAVYAGRMAGHTEDIAGGLPRITFWKSGRRREDGDDF
jgi:hypothetical protein